LLFWQNKQWFSGFSKEEEEFVNTESIFEAMFWWVPSLFMVVQLVVEYP
jgi:hypothetical protein